MLTLYHAQSRPRYDTTIRSCPQAVRTFVSTRSSALSHGRPAGLYCMSNGKLCRVPSRLSKHGDRVTEQPRTYCGDRCCHRKIKTHVCPYCSSHSRRFRFILETRLKIHLSSCYILCYNLHRLCAKVYLAVGIVHQKTQYADSFEKILINWLYTVHEYLRKE